LGVTQKARAKNSRIWVYHYLELYKKLELKIVEYGCVKGCPKRSLIQLDHSKKDHSKNLGVNTGLAKQREHLPQIQSLYISGCQSQKMKHWWIEKN
jgi:hypothetical protein